MSRHSLKIGAAIAICGNVVIDRTIAEDQELEPDPQPGQRVGAERADDQREHRRHERHDRAVPQRGREVRVVEDRLVVVQRRVRRQQRRRRQVRARLQRRVDQPVEREQAEQHDRDDGEPQPPRRAAAGRSSG